MPSEDPAATQAGDTGKRLTQLETTLWGVYGDNGLRSDVKRHGEQIGDLFGRDETLRQDLSNRVDAINSRLLLLTITVAGGALAIVGTLLGVIATSH